MKKLWENFYYSEWFPTVLGVLLALIILAVFSVVGILLNVWFVHFMKDTFGINVYWTIN